MKLDIVGATSRQRSLPFNAERTINFFQVIDQRGKEQSALYGTPGLSLFALTGSLATRGNFTASNGRCFFVAGSSLYEVNSTGTVTNRGSLLSSTGNVSIDENGTQLGICDGQKLYIFTYSSNAFALVTDADLPASVGFLTAIDGYMVVTENNTQKWYISDLGDGSSWQALEFASAEKNPDNLKAVTTALGQLWLFGDRTTEIWTNTGASNFPFRRVGQVVIEMGIQAPHSVQEVDNSVIWIGQNAQGGGVVYRTEGSRPEVISTEPINLMIRNATDKQNITSWVYQEDGHTFYAITNGGLETTLVYDTSTAAWHERSYNDSGNLTTHLAQCCTYAFDKQLVGDRRNGNIYEMSLSYYSDNGEDIVSERTFTNLSDMNRRVRYNAIEISLETGVGNLVAPAVNPQISLQLSKDGARTWSNWFNTSMGELGKYLTKATFRRLGIAEQMTFRIRISDQVKKAITGAYLR